MVEEDFQAARQRLHDFLVGQRSRFDEVKVQMRNLREFIEQAPNLTQYELHLRLAQARTLADKIEELGAGSRWAAAELRRIQHEMLLAGCPLTFNDNSSAG